MHYRHCNLGYIKRDIENRKHTDALNTSLNTLSGILSCVTPPQTNNENFKPKSSPIIFVADVERLLFEEIEQAEQVVDCRDLEHQLFTYEKLDKRTVHQFNEKNSERGVRPLDRVSYQVICRQPSLAEIKRIHSGELIIFKRQKNSPLEYDRRNVEYPDHIMTSLIRTFFKISWSYMVVSPHSVKKQLLNKQKSIDYEDIPTPRDEKKIKAEDMVHRYIQ